MKKLYLIFLVLISGNINASNNSANYSEPIISEECESDVSRLFPDYGSIDKYYLDMLSEGIPSNGNFSPSASQLVSEYHSSPVIGYKDLTRIYTYTDNNGIDRSIELIIRVHETVSAGASREIVVSRTDPPFTAIDSLEGSPSSEGSWNNLTDGIFDPAVDTSGVYTYVVPGGSCTDSAYLVIIVDGNYGELGYKNYSFYAEFNGADQNYIYSRSPRKPIKHSSEIKKENEVMEQVTYFDGLGRPKQLIGIRAGGDLEDLVTHVEFDAFGRQVKEYLPYAVGSQDGQLLPNPLAAVFSFYNTEKYENTLNPYSEKALEASPLNRVSAQGAPGEAWALGGGHEIGFAYLTNEVGEVRLFKVSFQNGDYRAPQLSESGYYEEGSLYKIVTYDEEHFSGKNHSTEEFKDKQGRVILKRIYADTDTQAEEAHDTYYVYDDYGNLTFVLPPKMESTDAALSTLIGALPDLGYQYEYDHRNRLVEKQLPGKGREYIVYNQLDQPILTQDALQRSSNEWLYTKYDGLGRVVQTGIYSHGTSLDQGGMQGVITTHEAGATVYETKSGTSYTNQSFPTSNKEMLTENYYDSYAFDHTGIIIPGNNVYGQTIVSNKVQGLGTGSRVKVLGTSNWITTVNGYDNKGRSIWNATKNDFLETIDIVESELDFVDNTLRQKTTHHKVNIAEDIIRENIFTYDHMNRMLTHTQTINGGTAELIAHNTYEELGQLTTKGVGFGTESVESEDDFLETTYTGIVNAIINADGSIAKTGSSEEEGFVETEQEFSQDGYVEFTPSGTDRLFKVGLTYEDPDYLDSDFNYYAYVVRNYIRTYEGGSEGWYSPATQTPVAPGDIITVERIGYKIYYKKNGETFYVSPHISAGKLKGKVQLSAAGTNGTSVGYMELHKLDRKPEYLQEINFAYNIRGWLKQINDPENLGNDLFGFGINYQDPKGGAIPLFNGNISETYWISQSENTSGNTVSNYYGYSYDALNRITAATDNTGNYNLGVVDYDKNGNILSLQRQGQIGANATLFGNMDQLQYAYDGGNQLLAVEDHSTSLEGFKDGNKTGDDYSYDVNGNLTSDANKVITSVLYNHLNMPTEIKFNNSSTQKINYTYSANGIKLRKATNNGGTVSTTDYAGNFIYENSTLKQFYQAEGYVEPKGSGWQYVYQYRDIWGNSRITYADDDNSGSVTSAEIRREQNYYPFGLEHKGYNITFYGAKNNLKTYQGQEFTEDLGLNTHEWKYRMSDPAIGRFWQIDPLTEEYTYNSTYAFQENKLGSGIELEGLENVNWSEFGNGYNRTVQNFNNNFYSNVSSFLRGNPVTETLTLAQNTATNVAQTAADVTGVSNALGLENQTQQSIEEVVNTVQQLPNMSDGQRGAVFAGALIFTAEALVEKKLPIHGNSKLSTKTQHGYEIKNISTGEVLEYGISGQKLNNNGTSPRVTQKLRTKYGNDPNISGQVVKTGVPTRAEALQWEQNQVNYFSILNNGDGPRFQKRPQPNN